MPRLRIISFLLILGALLPACSGGPKHVKLTGKLVRDGQPLKLPALSMVNLTFVPVLEDGKTPPFTYSGHFDREASSFTVLGMEGNGIPVGKYRIAIQQHLPDSPTEIGEMNQRFGKDNSPIIVDVADEHPLVVDLVKATVR